MSATTAPLPEQSTDPSRDGQRRRRPRHRNRQGHASQEHEQEQTPSEQPPPQRGGRSGRGRARGQAPSRAVDNGAGVTSAPPAQPRRGRGGAHNQLRFPQRTAGGRQFGGQLSVEDAASTSAPEVRSCLAGNNDRSLISHHSGGIQAEQCANKSLQSHLQADAPEFQPGRPILPRQSRPPRQKKPQVPKSTAPDIATRTHEDIDNGHYECAICTEEVRRTSRGVWSCRTCWTVFHLGCIKKWSTNEGSAAARQQAPDGELPPPRQWRCPGCNLPKDELPKSFACWCEKELEPKSLPGLPPFSCGQTCARPRTLPKKCPHPCPVTCHAGPCPPCTQMGPTQHCFCGKKVVTRRCVDTDYEHGWSCGDICGHTMPCGEHCCPRPCHEGLCGACEVRIPARCYCGQVDKDILCCDRGDERSSSQSHIAEDGSTTVEHWTGLFQCPNACARKFDCGIHACKNQCHPQDAKPAHCPRSPDVVSHCPCGKTPLNEISNAVRFTCEDPIPNCSKACRKLLDCGHECQQPCHQGDCPPCLRIVSIACRCGRTTSTTVCHQGTEEPPQVRNL